MRFTMQDKDKEMMQSGECGNMMDGAKECSEMMGGSSPSDNTETEDGEHCGDMGFDMGSMMGSKSADTKHMM